MRIEIDNLERQQVLALLEEHLQDMYATSPPESVHALDVSKLKLPSITFWTGWDGEQLLGCVAMSQLEDGHAELKSMRTTPSARKQGVASRLLNHVIEQAKHQGIQRLSWKLGRWHFLNPRIAYMKNMASRTASRLATINLIQIAAL